jgi:hypothetical protein
MANEKEVFKFLEDLQESGQVNMSRAAPYIRDHFNVNMREANDLLKAWVKSNNERLSRIYGDL